MTLTAGINYGIQVMDSVGNIKSGLEAAKGNAMDIIQFIVNFIIVPLSAAVILGFIIFFIVGAAKKHKMGEEYQDDIIKIVIAIVMLALVVSFPAWGWTMIGVKASESSSSEESSSASAVISMLLTRMW